MRRSVSSAKELGYDCLKPKQLEVMSEFVSGKDVFVCLPTGSDKSLCYALLPLVFDKLTRDHRKPQRTSSCRQSSYSPDERPGRQF